MSTPERILAWPWEVNPNMGQWETQQSIKGEGAEYIRADAVAEMIRQAVADASGLHLVIAAIREATVGGKPMLSDLPAALLEWRQAAVQAERERLAGIVDPEAAAELPETLWISCLPRHPFGHLRIASLHHMIGAVEYTRARGET